MDHCIHCEDMPEKYYCIACGKTGAEIAEIRGRPSDFTFQWYLVTVKITGKTPVILFRHGPRKDQVKSGGWDITLLETPTHYYNYELQGIRNAAHCESIVCQSYEKTVLQFESAGYTDIRLTVTAGGVYL